VRRRNYLFVIFARLSEINNCFSRKSHGAIEKTDYIKSLGYKGEMKFFVFDGKVYSNFSQFSLNGGNWFEFCDKIADENNP